MRFIKRVFFFVAFMVLAAIILSFFAPIEQKVTKSIVIDAPATKVYQQMLLLQNFNNWSVWGKADSSIKYTTRGNDGVPGAVVSWEGRPELSGKGEISLTGLKEDKEIAHHISFLEPRRIEADSKFSLSEKAGKTTVTWVFAIPSRRPLNIFNFFYNLEKERGKDFEAGLAALKIMVETSPLKKKSSLKVEHGYFNSTNYVGIKQTVLWVDFKEFLNQHFDHLLRYTLKGNYPDVLKTLLIFKRNDSLQQSKIAAACPIPDGFKPELHDPEEQITVAASNTIEVTFASEENIKQQAYKALNDYVAQNKLTLKKPIIEEYSKKDSLFQTKIIYLVN